ncbi:MAG: 50S ribosomal protein L35ae, partial [Candidatus Paceibacteria bacterium]
MKGFIINYRGSLKVKKPKQMIVKIEGIDTKKDVSKVIGKKVTWTSPTGKKISGLITQPHGNKGAVRVLFSEKGLPGQALGQQVEVE